MGRCKHCTEYICECQIDTVKLTAHSLKWAVIKRIVQETDVTVYAALAHLDKKLNNSLEFTITSRVSPIDLMNIPDIQRIVALTPYR